MEILRKMEKRNDMREKIKVLFICHGTTADSRDLSVLVGQNGANHGFWDGGVLRFYYD